MEGINIEEIAEAKILLKDAERSFPSEESAIKYSEAFIILNEYLKYENPENSIVKYIDNIKIANTRSALRKILEYDVEDFNVFLHYAILFNLRMNNEIKLLTQKDQSLKSNYDVLYKKFKVQIDEIS